MKDYLLIIPAYNEEKAIGGVLEQIIDGGYLEKMDVLVVNDCSSDKTAEVVSGYPEIHLISHVFNLGYGSALQTGYRFAAKSGYKFVLQMDADGQHDICNLDILMEALAKPDEKGILPDIVIGSRFEKKSKSFSISFVKKLSISFFRFLIRLTTGKRILDPTSGLQALERGAFEYYAGYLNFDNDYPDANMIIQMLMMGYEIVEVPSVMHERVTGTSMHAGLVKPIIYMLMMPLNIFAVYMRLRSGKSKKVEKRSAQVEPEKVTV